MKDIKAVFRYLTESGRKVALSTLYKHQREGLLVREKDGTFLPKKVDIYAASLPMVAGVAPENRDKAEAIALKKAHASVMKEEESAKMLRRKREILEGKYIERDTVATELAGRVALFEQGILSRLYLEAPDIIQSVGGDTTLTTPLVDAVEAIIGDALRDYAKLEGFDMQIDISQGIADIEALGGDMYADD